MNNPSNNIQNLLTGAVDDGIISPASQQILVENINASVIAGAAGKDAEEIDAAEVTLVTVVIDDSNSISYRGNADSIIKGQNEMIQSLLNSKQKDEIMIAQWKLGSKSELMHSYVPVKDAELLNSKNYNPRSGTALYDVWVDALSSNIAYAQTLAATGTQVTSIAIILTDGMDEHSRKNTAADCASITQDVMKSEMFHLAFIGVGNESSFRNVGKSMGFPDQSILVASATESEIRKAINIASQSIIRASQGMIQPGVNSGFFAA